MYINMALNALTPRKPRRIFKPEILILYYALRDKRTPGYAKLPSIISLIYLLSPVDIIPDVIPLAGYLDDLVIVPLLLQLSVRLLPAQVKADSMVNAAKHARRLKIWAGVLIVCMVLLMAWMFFIVKSWFQ
jgi:uncharacterized membrane protein YkvA (DUF1232 family)